MSNAELQKHLQSRLYRLIGLHWEQHLGPISGHREIADAYDRMVEAFKSETPTKMDELLKALDLAKNASKTKKTELEAISKGVKLLRDSKERLPLAVAQTLVEATHGFFTIGQVQAYESIPGGVRVRGNLDKSVKLSVLARVFPEHVEVEEWRDGEARQVWTHDRLRQIWTYAEGDLILEIYESQEAYQGALVRAADFYREECQGR